MTTDSRTRIRAAVAGEVLLLSDLALRSKAHWGYDADFLEACRAELTIPEDYVRHAPLFVLEEDGRVVGFYGLREEGGELELLYLFVEPTAIGGGYGKQLWEHAVETAARLGFRRITIESDPYAEAFYLAMGARRVGEISSNVRPGRTLPLLEFALDPEKL
ncbi:MAG TPA: GNAT family N-acetyltransferase [Pyrinomonadaceae bacterium]|nr:GNAT family N-acetyltransferase [Pyrinomonadaceae bacterium]